MTRKVFYDELLAFLQDHPGEKWRASQLAPVIGFDRGPIQNALVRAVRENKFGAAQRLTKQDIRYDPWWCWQPVEIEAEPPAEVIHEPDRFTAPAGQLLRWFTYQHLSGDLRAVSAECAQLADSMYSQLQVSPELTAGLRKLLEAKDCFVRAALLTEVLP